jgi:hypothetical protein
VQRLLQNVRATHRAAHRDWKQATSSGRNANVAGRILAGLPRSHAAPLPSDPIQEPRDQGEKPGAPGLHHRTVLTAATHYHQNWYIQTGGFPNASIFIVSQPKEGSEHRCARSGEKPALAQSSPLLQARACISSGRAQAGIAGAKLMTMAASRGQDSIPPIRAQRFEHDSLARCTSCISKIRLCSVRCVRSLPNTGSGRHGRFGQRLVSDAMTSPASASSRQGVHGSLQNLEIWMTCPRPDRHWRSGHRTVSLRSVERKPQCSPTRFRGHSHHQVSCDVRSGSIASF